MQAGFVARGFSGLIDHLAVLIQQAITHEGFSLLDVLQPCVSFNKVNTFAWYKKRCYILPEDYDPTDGQAAMRTATEWGEKIPLGLIYHNDRKSLEKSFAALEKGTLATQGTDLKLLKKIMTQFI